MHLLSLWLHWRGCWCGGSGLPRAGDVFAGGADGGGAVAGDEVGRAAGVELHHHRLGADGADHLGERVGWVTCKRTRVSVCTERVRCSRICPPRGSEGRGSVAVALRRGSAPHLTDERNRVFADMSSSHNNDHLARRWDPDHAHGGVAERREDARLWRCAERRCRCRGHRRYRVPAEKCRLGSAAKERGARCGADRAARKARRHDDGAARGEPRGKEHGDRTRHGRCVWPPIESPRIDDCAAFFCSRERTVRADI